MSTAARTPSRRRTRVRLTPRRRHLAAIVTIALSTAFIAVMILAGNLMTLSLTAGVDDTYRGADLVISPTDEADGSATPKIAGTDHVWPQVDLYTSIEGSGSASATTQLHLDAPTSEGIPALAAGSQPTGSDQVVIDQSLADALHVAPGDQIIIPADTSPTGSAVRLTVSGVARPTGGTALLGGSSWLHLTEASMPTVFGTDGFQASTWFATVPAGGDPDAVAASADAHYAVQTAQDAKDEAVQMMLQGLAALALILGVFVVIALVTSAVVIANTFAVTIAQRVRTLALLRTLGASRSQVARIVMGESLAVGLIGSLIGVALGHLLVQGALALAAAVGWIGSVIAVPVSLWSVLLPIIADIAVTVAAGIGPLRTATRVAPLQALRPQSATPGRRPIVRGVIAAVLVLLGLALLAVGVSLALGGSAGAGVLASVAGGVLSFAGVLIGLVIVTGPLARAGGALIGAIGGLPARMAVATTRRNPGRSAATIGALVIGTTLMTMMAVGASSADTTLTTQLASRRPVDVVVTAEKMPDDAQQQIADIRGLEDVQRLERGDVEVGASEPMTVYAATPQQIDAVANRDELGSRLTDATIVLGSERAETFGVTDGQTLAVTGADGRRHSVKILIDGDLNMSLTTPDTLAELTGTRTPVIMARFADQDSRARQGVSAMDLGTEIQKVTQGSGWTDANSTIGGAERESYSSILSVLLGITVALLAVAVIVALVGVANTLSLGVIERTGENALLRALGTTRGQMRAMLGWEGVLLALIGAVIGIVLGSVYGILGIEALLGGAYPVMISIPWLQILLVLVLAVLAGLLASILPGRRAARTAPAAALAGADG